MPPPCGNKSALKVSNVNSDPHNSQVLILVRDHLSISLFLRGSVLGKLNLGTTYIITAMLYIITKSQLTDNYTRLWPNQ